MVCNPWAKHPIAGTEESAFLRHCFIDRFSQEKMRMFQQTRFGYRQKTCTVEITWIHHLPQKCPRLQSYQILYSGLSCATVLNWRTEYEFQSTSDLHCTEDQLYHQRLRFPVALPHLRRVAGALRFAGCTAACRGGSRSRSAAGFRKFSSYAGWIETSMAGVLQNKMCLNHNYSAGDLSLFHH
jgi:hypothetical protein